MRRSPASRVISTGCAEPITRPVYARPAAQPRPARPVHGLAATPPAPPRSGRARGSVVPIRLACRARGGLLALLQALSLLVALAAPAAAGPTEGAKHPWPRRPAAAAALPAAPRPLHLAEAQLA